MKIATDRRKNIISHVKGTLDTMLRICLLYTSDAADD